MAYKRSILLIDPKFQIKFSFLICIIILIANSIYPFVIYDNYSQFIQFSQKYAPQFSTKLIQNKNELMVVLIIWQVAFFILSFGVMIFFTHKIAGPIFKLKQFFSNLRTTSKYTPLYFRKGDYFQEIVEEYNQTFEIINENTKTDSVYISEVITYLKNLEMNLPENKKIVCKEIQNNLEKLSDNYHL